MLEDTVITIDKNRMTIGRPDGPQIKSSVAWHLIAALYLRFSETPHTQGELSLSELQRFPFFSRYERDSLRVSIARAITTIEHHFSLVDYEKKSTGPWRLAPAVFIDVQPSLIELQAKLQYRAPFTQQLIFEDEQELLQFARYLVDGDCLLHTGNQLDAALSCYYSATLFSNPLLNATARLRFVAALIRLGDFQQAKQTIAQTDWGPKDSYTGVHARFLQYRLDRLAGHESSPPISAEMISLPDDITRALALTLNAFTKRDQASQKASEGGSKAVIKQLTHECIADLLNAIFLRLRASHYDNIQQSAFNLANAFYILSDIPNSPLQWPEISDQIFTWCDLCDTVCDTFEVGQDTYLNNLLRAETLARNPDTAHLALPAAKDALAKSRNNGNVYDQLELSSLIERLESKAQQQPS